MQISKDIRNFETVDDSPVVLHVMAEMTDFADDRAAGQASERQRGGKHRAGSASGHPVACGGHDLASCAFGGNSRR